MWTSGEIDSLARDRQAELLRLAADVRLEREAQAGRGRRIADEVPGALRGFLRCFSAVAVLRKLAYRTSAQAAPGTARS